MITKFGSYIRERRISAGLGQRELAKKNWDSGILFE
jgi:hypothetical protein